MIAIRSKYHGPTNYRGSIVRASANGRSAQVPWAAEWDSEDNHRRAVVILCAKLGWDADRFFGGNLESGEWVWVPVFTADWEKRQREQEV